MVDLVETGGRESDVRELHSVSGARLVQALFDALALPQIAVSPAEIVEFALTGLFPTRPATRGQASSVRPAALP